MLTLNEFLVFLMVIHKCFIPVFDVLYFIEAIKVSYQWYIIISIFTVHQVAVKCFR